MNTLFLIALALASPDYDLSWKGGMSCADGTCTIPGDDLALDCNTCPCLIYQESETTDAAGCGMTMHAGHAYGTSRDGGDLILAGGDGSHSIACNASIASGDTVTTSVDGTALTALTEGVDFDCSGTNDACCTSLCAAIEAQSGVSCSGTATPINPQVDETNSYVTFTVADGAADGEFAVDTAGSVGILSLPDSIYIGGDSSSGLLLKNTSTYVNFRNGTDSSYRNIQAGYVVGAVGMVSRTRMVLGNGELSIYPSNGSPEGNLSAVGGSLALDYTNYDLYVKTTASGNTGWVSYTGGRIENTSPSEPYVCSASTAGPKRWYVNDTDDGAPAEVCVCHGITNDATYDWVRATDETTACTFF